jgi:hypothetical protein
MGPSGLGYLGSLFVPSGRVYVCNYSVLTQWPRLKKIKNNECKLVQQQYPLHGVIPAYPSLVAKANPHAVAQRPLSIYSIIVSCLIIRRPSLHCFTSGSATVPVTVPSNSHHQLSRSSKQADQ